MELLAVLTLMFFVALLLAIGQSNRSSAPTIIVNSGSDSRGSGRGAGLVVLLLLITIIALGGQSLEGQGVTNSATAPSETEYTISLDQEV